MFHSRVLGLVPFSLIYIRQESITRSHGQQIRQWREIPAKIRSKTCVLCYSRNYHSSFIESPSPKLKTEWLFTYLFKFFGFVKIWDLSTAEDVTDVFKKWFIQGLSVIEQKHCGLVIHTRQTVKTLQIFAKKKVTLNQRLRLLLSVFHWRVSSL